MDILDIYRSIMRAAGFTVTEDDMISVVSGDKSKPFTIEGKRLVVPSTKQTSVANWENRLAFHPLQENTMAGESKVMKALRGAFNIRLNYVTGTVLTNLVRIAVEVETTQGKLTPDQQQFLSLTKDADQRSFDDLAKILDEMPVNQIEKQFVRIFVRKGGIYKGTPHSRLGVTAFPLYNELKQEAAKKGKHAIYGVNVRVKDMELYMNLLQYIFPRIAEPEAYNFGSNSRLVPSIHALMSTVMLLASELNTAVDLFKNVIEKSEELLFDAGWVEGFQDIDTLAAKARMIPMLPGNEGSMSKVEEQQKGAQVQMNAGHSPTAAYARGTDRPQEAASAPAKPQYAEPIANTQVSKGKISFDEVMASNPNMQRQTYGYQTPYTQQPPNPQGVRDAHRRPPSWANSGGYGYAGGGGNYPQQGQAHQAPGYGRTRI